MRPLGMEEITPEIRLAFEKQHAQEITRQQQQGLGRPIISCEFQGYRMVAVGGVLSYSKKWKTFHDFLFHYIQHVIGPDWGADEIAKPIEQRHPILQWYDEICRYQKETLQEHGRVTSVAAIGVVEAYLHLAYNLYLIAHNTINNKFNDRLQKRLIDRLKDEEAFPGAYHECYVFALLVRAGFEVEFENETDGSSKHCDFTVTCKKSDKKYSVEAKAIRREGAYGAKKNTAKGSLTKSIRNQLYDALEKPSKYPRLIFIETNLPDIVKSKEGQWMDTAVKAVVGAEALTIKGHPTEPAYVALTNHPHHYHLQAENFGRSAVFTGYKIDDFGHGKEFRQLRDMYYAKQKHIDVHRIIDSVKDHYDIPATFDGSLPSEAFHGGSQRITIGQRYFFEDVGENGLEATVTSATVNAQEKVFYVGTDNGYILTCPISDEELKDYEKHPDTYFGTYHLQGKKTEEPFELFECMLSNYKDTPKDRLLESMKGRPDFDQLKSLDQKELAVICCEGLVNAMVQKQ